MCVCHVALNDPEVGHYAESFALYIAGTIPAPRRGHSASVLGTSEMLILGGLGSASTPLPLSELWRVDLAPQASIVATSAAAQTLTEGVYTWSSVTPSAAAAAGQCVQSVTVTVQIAHPCSRQLKLVLQGPGIATADANFAPGWDRTAGQAVLFAFAPGR